MEGFFSLSFQAAGSHVSSLWTHDLAAMDGLTTFTTFNSSSACTMLFKTLLLTDDVIRMIN